MAYGTDKVVHGEGDEEPSEAVAGGLHDRLARLEARGLAAADLGRLRADLDALEAKVAADEAR
jgi:hypothetical protein